MSSKGLKYVLEERRGWGPVSASEETALNENWEGGDWNCFVDNGGVGDRKTREGRDLRKGLGLARATTDREISREETGEWMTMRCRGRGGRQ